MDIYFDQSLNLIIGFSFEFLILNVTTKVVALIYVLLLLNFM